MNDRNKTTTSYCDYFLLKNRNHRITPINKPVLFFFSLNPPHTHLFVLSLWSFFWMNGLHKQRSHTRERDALVPGAKKFAPAVPLLFYIFFSHFFFHIIRRAKPDPRVTSTNSSKRVSHIGFSAGSRPRAASVCSLSLQLYETARTCVCGGHGGGWHGLNSDAPDCLGVSRDVYQCAWISVICGLWSA